MTEQTTTRPEGLQGVLDAMEVAVTQARAMPMSSSVLVNRAELLELVDQAREALPTQLSAADELLADADQSRARAQAEADAIVAAAREKAAALVEQEAVTVQAREHAAQLVAEAQATAERLRRDADDYCDRRLADFEIDLGKLLSQVQAGRGKLASRLGE
jgi:F0F1-type ATP synthase membrane subunit b/b'